MKLRFYNYSEFITFLLRQLINNCKKTGSTSDRSLFQDSSLSSFTSLDSKDSSVVTEDGEDVFSDETITYSDDESQSQIMASPKKVSIYPLNKQLS